MQIMRWILAATANVMAAAVAAAGSTITMEVEEAFSQEVEVPDPFIRLNDYEQCTENAQVASWCDAHVMPSLQCGMLSAFHEYACDCDGHPNLCPLECLEGSDLIAKTRSGIRCRGIPLDSPNYVLREEHTSLNHCEENSLVAAWCDEYVNQHVACGLYPALDQYVCRCSGRPANCPDECIFGSDALIRTGHGIVCTGIPLDSPNYELKES